MHIYINMHFFMRTGSTKRPDPARLIYKVVIYIYIVASTQARARPGWGHVFVHMYICTMCTLSGPCS